MVGVLGVRIRIAPDADLATDPITWPWQDITPDWIASQGLRIKAGADDEQTEGQAELELVLRNGRSKTTGPGAGIVGRYTQDNPMSDLWPHWTAACPVEIAFDWGAGFSAIDPYVGYVSALVYEWPGRSGRMPLVKVSCGGRIRQEQVGNPPVLDSLTRAIRADPVQPAAWWPCLDDPTATTPAATIGADAIVRYPIQPGQSRVPLAGKQTLVAAVQSKAFPARLDDVVTFPMVPAAGVNIVAWWMRWDPFATEGGGAEGSQYARVDHFLRFAGDMVIGELTSARIEYRATVPGSGFAETCQVSFGTLVNDGTGIADLAVLSMGSIRLGDGRWHEIQVWMTDSGANSNLALWVDGVQVATNTIAGKLCRPVAFGPTAHGYYVDAAGTPVAQPAPQIEIAHVTHYTAAGVSSHYRAGMGWPGEMAHQRLERVCLERGLQFWTAATETAIMGPQQPGTDVEILRECERTDRGILDDSRAILTYRSLAELLNRDAALTIDGADWQLGSDWQPTLDDQRARTVTTASPPTGGVSVTVDSGRTPRYEGSLNPNVLTVADLTDQAGWRNREGELSTRYPSLSVWLHTVPAAFVGEIMGLWLGDVAQLINPPRGHAPGSRLLQLRGWEMTLAGVRGEWRWAANCISAAPYEVGVLGADNPVDDDPHVGWADWDSCTLAAGITAAAASFNVLVSPAMSTLAADYPCPVYVDGELMTITSCVFVAGSTYTWTVTRHVNGVTKPHLAGAVVELAHPLILTL